MKTTLNEKDLSIINRYILWYYESKSLEISKKEIEDLYEKSFILYKIEQESLPSFIPWNRDEFIDNLELYKDQLENELFYIDIDNLETINIIL